MRKIFREIVREVETRQKNIMETKGKGCVVCREAEGRKVDLRS